jgi:multiple sugar transport system ATP-binding protein
MRPEDVHMNKDDGLKVTVNVLERLGGTSITYGQLPNSQIKFCAALAGDARIKEGEVISLSVNPDDCHVFDAAGRVLRRTSAPSLID